jgi:hypothetical protein
MNVAPPRGTFGASPSRGRHQRPGKAGSAVALENTARVTAMMLGAMENQNG